MFLIDELILVGSVLLLLGIISNLISSRLGVPVLVLFLFLGMLAGSEGIGGIEFSDYQLAHAVGTIALAMILFDGGLSTKSDAVVCAWKPAVSLATVGVFITAGVTGIAASYILGLTWLQGLLLGSIVGSTDAAAVFSILRNSGVTLPQKISSTLEVESGSNDPMAIFLTIGCIELIAQRMDFGPALLLLFLVQMVVGLLVGVGVGALAVWVVNRIQLGSAGLFPVLVSAFCLLSFGLSANLGGSGFLAVYLSGLVLGNRRLIFQRGIRLYHDAIAWLAQILMFVMLGLLSFPSRLWAVSGKALLVAAVLILVARPLACVCSLLPFRFDWRSLTFISWVGLKGAVPITLATFPLMMGTPNASLYFDTVFFIVVLSALVQGSTLPFAAKLLGLQQPPEPEPPVTLEISTLRHVDGDIVDFLIGEDSRAAGKQVKDLALPEGVVIALIVREDQLIPPQGTTRIQSGDHAILVLRPGTRPLVNQIFGRSPDQRGEIPEAFEFPLRASITVAELHEFYGIWLDLPGDVSLAKAIREIRGSASLQEGTEVRVGPLSFTVRSLKSDGSVEMIGMTILSDREIRAAERAHEIR
ncbi:MAG: potassium/proton antiporter [Rubinisphaera brasiliensis]|uniref:Potassium/proton antiporter, CPA1 family n=1 Tax=Rubinisphaera brasiliensis (strain ATCC 49424 / DSM 5305 / JCM 21570 / IAM 15109 / NBRC 103401 / IFAM 1448) TaxID=756272 RepID=F0SRX0_RUBBR|nr:MULTISPECIES: potassium/proton antiporter [Rubinisphaera]ADY60286.1 potassium/proton antiporter, CPA1 family [Rubinisphaera brasiliensis DSM 5305]